MSQNLPSEEAVQVPEVGLCSGASCFLRFGSVIVAVVIHSLRAEVVFGLTAAFGFDVLCWFLFDSDVTDVTPISAGLLVFHVNLNSF